MMSSRKTRTPAQVLIREYVRFIREVVKAHVA